MRAVVATKYSQPEVLAIRDIQKPVPNSGFDAVRYKKNSALKKALGRCLKPNGRSVSVDDRFMKPKTEYLDYVNTSFKEGILKAVIGKVFTLQDIVEAHNYVDTGYKSGNVVVKVDENQDVEVKK